MKVTVQLFARARDLAGADHVVVELIAGANIRALRVELGRRFPSLKGLLDRSAIGVNNEFAQDADLLPPNAEVALLPPVSGGA